MNIMEQQENNKTNQEDNQKDVNYNRIAEEKLKENNKPQQEDNKEEVNYNVDINNIGIYICRSVHK